ncbi:diguanylate cyclase/phosphodiesterase with PAS/PAC sensor domains protein [Herbaspirillum seropedicae SmR1]|uniref:Diguanylate cyclase/phosphodiesterase with PAS/PAC sensor domains protein n=1 Tax=Herbaspirillum seropedicae (strain SmR1) TaxID=757424 RepID=D8IQH6_HERSS|nr:diguanylate cyclase/phosphodiesterase with PAS/PAC sensor domains protein [Herbaspirillum seropedicae SmR1]AON55966.1 diguanylate cyclase/phosphodiesterase with PAS/PAC sensor domains protein [Herbaspirillum seropedicae]
MAIPRSPRLLETLLVNLDGVVYRCRDDAQWTMEFVSEGCLALTGYLPEDLLLNQRLSFLELTHPEDRTLVRNHVDACMRERRRIDIEYRIVRADGAVRWVWERGVGIYNANGQVEAIEGFLQDVTERKEAAQALQEAERRYRSIFENAIEGVFQTTPDGTYIAVNPALARIYGYHSPEDLIVGLRDISHQLYVEPERRQEFMRLMEEQGSVSNFESRVYRRDGEIIWISENARAVYDEAGKLSCYEGTVEAITERKAHEAEMRHQATHDALTGLPNRNMLHEHLQRALRVARQKGALTAVAFVDLDQFKFINDSLGHQVGDELLKTVAQRLQACLREADMVARQGGDEFVLVLQNQTEGEAGIAEVMQRILAAVARPWQAGDREFQVTASIGVSRYPADGKDVESLLKHADSAMYRAKEQGRNNFQFFAPWMDSQVSNRLEMLINLRRALDQDEFKLYYQPKLSLQDGRLIGAEALIRWESPQQGMVPPDRFIPFAEEAGLIVPIGEWVLRTACRQNQAWQQAGLPPIPVAVNLSPRQLNQSLPDFVAGVLAQSGLAASWLELEITENVVMKDAEKSVATLHALKRLGLQISVDDFGTGYSSLSYLRRFPVDALKIDKSFVRDIVRDADSAAIVKAIISLAHILNLRVIAEGVEDEEQHAFLKENACDEVQGYYFGKPMEVAVFTAWMSEQAQAGQVLSCK